MSKNPGFIQGEYKWSMGKERIHGEKRISMHITKGAKVISKIYWHPSSKCLVCAAKYDFTSETIDFMRPFMEKKTFYFCWKIDKLMRQQSKELKSHSYFGKVVH
jgi:hypothetical protein